MATVTPPRLESSFLKAAYSVLKDWQTPLTARAITRIATDQGFLDENRRGKTPAQTMKSKLSVHIRRHGADSIFVRAGPGKFFLRELSSDTVPVYEAPPFSAGLPDERVVAFSQEVLDDVGRFQGIARSWETYYQAITIDAESVALDRMLAENSTAYKQLITYVLVRDEAGSLLCFDRGVVNRVDDMLRGKSCVGFGGHVKAAPPTLFQTDAIGLFAAAAQEVTEELSLPEDVERRLLEDPERELSLIGVLNDDSSPVGLKHFAFVFEMVLDPGAARDVTGREKSINRVRWLTLEAANRESVHKFEYWSQLCLRHFAPDLASATPASSVRRPRRLRTAKTICCVGQMGSGKTEAVSLMAEQLRLTPINSGVVVADLIGLPAVPKTPRKEFQEAAGRFISKPEGPEILGRELARRAALASGRVVIDGIRQAETLEVLKAELGANNVAVVYVHAPIDIAYEFYRDREDATASIADFTARRSARVEIQVAQMLDQADAALYNWIGRDEYQNMVSSFATRYLNFGVTA